MNTDNNINPQQKEIGGGEKMKNRKRLKEISQELRNLYPQEKGLKGGLLHLQGIVPSEVEEKIKEQLKAVESSIRVLEKDQEKLWD